VWKADLGPLAVQAVGILDPEVAACRRRERVDVRVAIEVELERASADDQVVPLLRRRAPILEAEPLVERERLAQVAAGEDRDGAGDAATLAADP
jgi:hypothetical protein